MVLKKIKYGYRADNLYILNPWVKKIYQTEIPLVKIRCHAGSEGAKQIIKYRVMDNILYLLIQYSYAKNIYQKIRFVKEILSYFKTGKDHIINCFIYFYRIQLILIFLNVGINFSIIDVLVINFLILRDIFMKSINKIKRFFKKYL